MIRQNPTPMSEDISRLSIDKSKMGIRPHRSRKTWLFLILLIVAGLAFLYHKGMLTPAVPVTAANVSLVYPSQSLSLLNASGYVVAQRKASVASKTTGRLIDLMVEEGSKVVKGQIIAKLEDEDLAAAKAQAEANLKTAEANLRVAKVDLQDAELNFSRNKRLISSSSIAQFQYDEAEIRYRRAKASVEAAEAAVKAQIAAIRSAEVALDYTFIKAPFDAVVLTKNADIGDIVTPIGAASEAKAAVVTIADTDSFQVEADVSETNISMVKLGQPCEIMLDAISGVRMNGKVHMIVPTVDRGKASIMVKVAFAEKDSRIFPNMSAKVSFLSRELIEAEQKPRVAVSNAAIVGNGEQKTVFQIQDGLAKEIAVRTGETMGDMIEITDGLKAGDKVVSKPNQSVKDGVKIRIEEK